MVKTLLTALFMITLAFPQSETLSTGMGVSAGLLTGSGLSYRHLGEHSGWQFTFGVISFPGDNGSDYMMHSQEHYSYQAGDWLPDTSEIYRTYDYSNGRTWANAGLLYLKPLHRSETSMFFLMGGISAYYSSSTDYYTDYQYRIDSDSTYTYMPVSDRKLEKSNNVTFRAGVGIGLEYNITENIRASLDLPLTISNDLSVTMLFPDVSVFYYFK